MDGQIANYLRFTSIFTCITLSVDTTIITIHLVHVDRLSVYVGVTNLFSTIPVPHEPFANSALLKGKYETF